MTQRLDALRQHSMVVADTGDLDAIKRYQPHDATTNPSLILKAFDLPGYQALIDQELAAVKSMDNGRREAHAVDRLAVAMGSEIAKLVPGRVSTEVAAKLSFDTQASIRKAHELIELYEQRGVSKDRVLIKLASTWEGICAAEVLENLKVKTADANGNLRAVPDLLAEIDEKMRGYGSAARSEMISMFDGEYAARCPHCGTSGRRIGTSCAAGTFSMSTTRVMISSSGAPRTSSTLPPSWRALVSGTILVALPAGIAAKP